MKIRPSASCNNSAEQEIKRNVIFESVFDRFRQPHADRRDHQCEADRKAPNGENSAGTAVPEAMRQR